MRSRRRLHHIVWLAALLVAIPARAELVEEIVAWVNGDIITSSQLEEKEQGMIAQAYRSKTGEELDREVENIRAGLLLQLIDQKILLHHAQMLYSTDRMADAFYESFKQSEGIESDEEFEKMLAAEGMTVDELKQELLETFAPDEVVKFEVVDRIAVGDKETRAYYDAHPEEFTVPAEVTIREIVILAEGEDAKKERLSEALDIRSKAEEGADFGELAQQYSDAGTQDEGGLMGPLKKGDLAVELETVAFQLPVGEVSQLLDMPYGYHLIAIETRTEEELKPYDELKSPLRDHLEDRKYFDELAVFMKKAREEAEWCVKPKYHNRVPVEVPECPEL